MGKPDVSLKCTRCGKCGGVYVRSPAPEEWICVNATECKLRCQLQTVERIAKNATRVERNRCAKLIGDAADRARDSNRKKAAAELDLLARDILEGA